MGQVSRSRATIADGDMTIEEYRGATDIAALLPTAQVSDERPTSLPVVGENLSEASTSVYCWLVEEHL